MDLTRRRHLLPGVVVVGILLRLFQLGTESIWLDEAASIGFVSRLSLWEIFFILPTYETHPPLYYAILEIWTQLVGFSEVAIRLPSVIFSVATIPVLYFVGNKLYGERVGLLATGVFAFSRFQVHYAQEARMYTLLTLLTVVSYYFLLCIVREWNRRLAAAYVLATLLLVYTHVYGLFVVAAQNTILPALLIRRKEWSRGLKLKRWIGLQTAVGIGAIPWVRLIILRIFEGAGRVSWIQPPTVGEVLATPYAYLGLSLETTAGYAVIAFTAVLISGVYLWYRQLGAPIRGINLLDSPRTAILGGWILVPILVPAVLSYLVTPVFIHKYTIVASVGLFVFVARGLDLLIEYWQPLGVVALALLLVAAGLPLVDYFTGDQKEQWREAASFVEDGADGDDVVLTSQTYVEMPFSYYYEGVVEKLYASANATTVNNRASGHDTVWLVLSHLDESDRQQLVAALNESYTVRSHRQFIGVEVYRFDQTSKLKPSNIPTQNMTLSS